MTKRISVTNATHADQAKVAVDASAVEATIAAAHAVTPAHADMAAGKAIEADVAVKAVADAAHADAPAAADVAPVELAMVSAGDATPAIFAAGGQDTTSNSAETNTDTSADTSYDSGNGDNMDLYVGGGLLAAAVVGAVLVGTTEANAEDHAGTPPPPPPANEAPVFADESQDVTTTEDTAVNVTVAATDADGDALTYTAGDAANGTVTMNDDGTFTYTPDADFSGTDTFTVTASDGSDDATQTINVTIDPVNDAPTFEEATHTATVAENSDVATAVYTAEATDADADDTLTYSLSGDDAAAFTIDADTGEIHFASSPDFEAQESYDVTVTATDEAGATGTQALHVDVTDVVDTVTMDLDTDTDSNLNTAASFDASGDDIVFNEDADASSNATIAGFAEGDSIVVSNVDTTVDPDTGNPAEEYSFTATSTDVIISFAADNGATNVITIEDVVTADSGFVFDEASAEAAVGFDFFQYA